MTHSLTPYLFLGNLYTATVTYYSAITNPLVFTAMTLIVLVRTKYAFTEESISLRFVCTIVNSFRFEHFTRRPLKNLLGRCQTNGNLVEITLYLYLFFERHIILFSNVQILNYDQSRLTLSPRPRSSCRSTFRDSGMPG